MNIPKKNDKSLGVGLFSAIMTLLAGCSSLELDRPETQILATHDTCGAAQMQALVGSKASKINMQFENPADEKNFRILGPKNATMSDHNSQRVNLLTDEKGFVRKVFCG